MNILTTIAQNLQESIAQNQNRTARAKAVRSALFAVTVRHLEYQATGFDQTLLNNQAAALIDPFVSEGVLPDADALAAIWATQFNLSTTGTQKAIANVMPMVNDFVYILATGNHSNANHSVDTQFNPAIAQEPSMMPSGYAVNLQAGTN